MACTLTATQTAACDSDIGKVESKIKLLQIIAQLTCEAAEAGGGGSGGAGSTVGVVDPEGVVVGSVGDLYYNSVLETFWVKVTGTSSTTLWRQLI